MKQMDEHFKELVYKYTNKLYVTAYNLCNNPSDAEDIVQETFMKYLKKKLIFANEEHEKAWLLRVTINLAKDYNKSFKEIGEILHRKTSTVSAQIQKAKELLKSQLLS